MAAKVAAITAPRRNERESALIDHRSWLALEKITGTLEAMSVNRRPRPTSAGSYYNRR